jgi:putative endonuclease
MQNKKRQFGDLGEKVAVKYLQNKGYAILDCNFQNNSGRRLGEIDIIANDPKEKELVFVEVKTREYEKFSETLPEENITYSKMIKLSKIAQAYLRAKKLAEQNYRFDAVSVWLDAQNKKARVKHIKSL